MSLKTVCITHLYPSEMNIYGDTGNRIILEQRLRWRGFEPVTKLINSGDKLPSDSDIILGGGGQDSGQLLVINDLAKKNELLNSMARDGVVMLMICGMYQLFGHFFLTNDGQKLPGISIFDLTTKASEQRLIGNITTESEFGRIVGYENHSGLTELSSGQRPLARCAKAEGNNGTDQTEGAISYNVFGSYLHGPILAKNPRLADELLKRALQRRFGVVQLNPIDDNIEHKAAAYAIKRPR